MKLSYKVENYDLKYTLYPSFTLSIYKKLDELHYVRAFGSFKGLEMSQDEDTLTIKYPFQIDEEILYYFTGLWFSPHDAMKSLSRSLRQLIYPIIREYSKIRISIEPYDRWMIFVATFLSRKTDYHSNVIMWCQKLFEHLNRAEDLINFDSFQIGRSFQLNQLRSAYKKYLKDIYEIEDEHNPAEVKKLLLGIPSIGPKVSSAYLLFTREAPWITPVDVHYIRFVRKLGLLGGRLKPPDKDHCKEFCDSCTLCPKNIECIEYKSMTKFKFLSGWLQTVSYVHDKLYCSKKLCDICRIKTICKEFK